jgi:hypothetical protein
MARKNDLFDKLAKAESDFLRREFLAPVLHGSGGVQVQIAGVRMKLKIEPRNFSGFGIFQPQSHTLARHVRNATMGERQRYLQLFPSVVMIACCPLPAVNDERDWLAIPANGSDTRFSIKGLAPLNLCESVDLFETVLCRFDGSQFWFDRVDDRADPGLALYLREAWFKSTPPSALERAGLSPQYRAAYAHAFEKKRAEEQARIAREREARRATSEGRLQDALEHAGAELNEFTERGDVYAVTYTVDGERHTSVVDRRSLAVITAGICLSGEDEKFDLASLVGVLRERDHDY